MDLRRLPSPPDLRAVTVQDLLDDARGGRLRVPAFQRPLRWTARHVAELFDSLLRGFPVGELLLWQRREPAAQVSFGPVVVEAPALDDALLLVDGQQRATALVGALLHPEEEPRVGPYALWVDLQTLAFGPRPSSPGPFDLPVRTLGDRAALHRWALRGPLGGDRDALAGRAFELEARLMKAKLHLTVLRASEVSDVRLIFSRVNEAGVRLSADEVFDAVVGQGDEKPLQELAARVHDDTGFGLLPGPWLLRVVRAVAGGVGAPGDAGLGVGALAEARAALRGAIGLLQGDAGVPHLRLLPYRAPLLVLARFAALHPQPLPRSRTLLTRWFWRGVVAGTHSDSSQATVLGQLRALDGDEEESVQRLIGLAPSCPDLGRLTALSAGWNARFAHTRVVAAVLAARACGDDGADLQGWSRARLQAALHQDEVSELFQPLLPGAAGSLAGRALLPPGLSPAALPAALDPELADALLINPAAAAALEAGDADALVAARAPLVAAEVERRLRQWAAPGEHDRPSVRHLLRAR